MTGSAKKNEESENIQSSSVNSSKRKLTIGNESISKFQNKQTDEEEVVTEIGFDAGNSNLDDNKVASKINNQFNEQNGSGAQ